MPEGPEIRRAADRIGAAIVDQAIHRVWFGHSRLQHYAKKLSQSTVVDVRTKGKALLTQFDCGLTIYSHNQLYGRWFIKPVGQRPKTRRQLRLAIETEHKSALLYSASDITVLADEELEQHPFLARAGIDILSDRPSLNQLAEYIRQARFARKALGGLLLDQSFVAGIGNYLRSEILFAANLRPEHKLAELDGHQSRKLARQIITMTERAYQTGGITNEAKIVRRLKSQGWTRSRYRHFVFSRAGSPCHLCGTAITKSLSAGRRLYLCSGCQP